MQDKCWFRKIHQRPGWCTFSYLWDLSWFWRHCMGSTTSIFPLQWRHNGRDSVSNHQPHDCLLNRLFRRRSKKTPKLRVTGLRAENPPGIGEFPAQMARSVENVSIWWRHQALLLIFKLLFVKTKCLIWTHSYERRPNREMGGGTNISMISGILPLGKSMYIIAISCKLNKVISKCLFPKRMRRTRQQWAIL